jgi:hypothetical protein
VGLRTSFVLGSLVHRTSNPATDCSDSRRRGGVNCLQLSVGVAGVTVRYVDPIPGTRPGIPEFPTHRRIDERGVTRPVSFPAVIARKSNGTYAAQALIDIDRTE